MESNDLVVCGISDIHGNLDIKIPKCNILCICGDVVDLARQRDLELSEKWWLEDFTEWAKNLDCDKILVVPGNHDFLLWDLYNRPKDNLDYTDFKNKLYFRSNCKIMILVDETYVKNDFKFYGCPWIRPISYQEGRWAFEATYEEDGTCEQYDMIPKCDVLITHDNPINNHTLGHYSFGKSYIHFYGHWHEGPDNGINRFNCSYLNDSYNPKKNFKVPVVKLSKQTTVEVLDEKDGDRSAIL